jgi:hypothetical protein
MPIIFGWGRRTRHLVLSMARQCMRCTRGQVFDLILVRVWFTLFFIPVIPYSKEYWFICRECKCGFKLSEAEFNDIKMRGQFGGESITTVGAAK